MTGLKSTSDARPVGVAAALVTAGLLAAFATAHSSEPWAGFLAGFDSAAAAVPWVEMVARFGATFCSWRATDARSTCSSRAIRRCDQPRSARAYIDCWMLTLSWFITPTGEAIFADDVNYPLTVAGI